MERRTSYRQRGQVLLIIEVSEPTPQLFPQTCCVLRLVVIPTYWIEKRKKKGIYTKNKEVRRAESESKKYFSLSYGVMHYNASTMHWSSGSHQRTDTWGTRGESEPESTSGQYTRDPGYIGIDRGRPNGRSNAFGTLTDTKDKTFYLFTYFYHQVQSTVSRSHSSQHGDCL